MHNKEDKVQEWKENVRLDVIIFYETVILHQPNRYLAL